MPKLLFLVHRIPYPPNKGDKIRSYHFLKALSSQYEIYLGCFIDDPQDRQYVKDLNAYCRECLCIEINPKLQKLKSLQGFLTGEALSLPYYRNARLQSWVDRTIESGNIEKVLVFSSPMAQYVEKYPSLRLIADFVDVDSDKWRQYAANKSWPFSWIYRRESQTLLTFERKIAGKFFATLFVSEQEAALFKQLAPASAEKIAYVNNGVDTDVFDPQLQFDTPFNTAEPVVVFTGAMDYWANVDAVIWFAQEVLPIIKKFKPQVRFYIVGSKPTQAVQHLALKDSAVIVTGRVDDVRNYLAHAHLVVAPLRIARGIQNKVLEALAFAKSIVATSMAMEGIPLISGVQVAIADTPEDFAELSLANLNLPVKVVQANRDYVQAEFGWSQSMIKLQAFLEK
jgi:sugar transferase (PEP-CTERM/EpsH1 system associated)